MLLFFCGFFVAVSIMVIASLSYKQDETDTKNSCDSYRLSEGQEERTVELLGSLYNSTVAPHDSLIGRIMRIDIGERLSVEEKLDLLMDYFGIKIKKNEEEYRPYKIVPDKED